MKYQNGSLRKKTRKDGSQVWEFRYRTSSGVMSQKTLKVSEYGTLASVKVALQTLIFSLNDPSTMNKTTPFWMVVERLIVEERLREILAQPTGAVTVPGMSYATAKCYMSYFRNYVLPKWAEVPIESIRPMAVTMWITELPLAGTTKGGLRGLMHMLFNRAMLWELIPIERNPMDLVTIKGVNKRKKKKIVLTIEQFHELREELPEPYRTMVTLAICTGLRVSEVLALRWEHIKDGALLVQASSYEGRVGAVKTEASGDEIPLHPDILAGWWKGQAEGLVFPSPVTGRTYHGGTIQVDWIRPAGLKLGLPHLGWHAFRHTYRSLLDDAPVGVQQKLMRHANVSTTMNVYGASAMKAKREWNSNVVEMVVGLVGSKTA